MSEEIISYYAMISIGYYYEVIESYDEQPTQETIQALAERVRQTVFVIRAAHIMKATPLQEQEEDRRWLAEQEVAAES